MFKCSNVQMFKFEIKYFHPDSYQYFEPFEPSKLEERRRFELFL